MLKLYRIDGLAPHRIGGEEAVYLFEPGRFEAVAALVHPKRKWRLSETAPPCSAGAVATDSRLSLTVLRASKRPQKRVSRHEANQTA